MLPEKGTLATIADLAMRAFGVLCLVVATVALVQFPMQWQEVTAANAASVCADGSSDDCLRPVDGAITETRSNKWGGKRHHFEPANASEPDAWVRFADDDSPAIRAMTAGSTVTAFYWEDEPYRFESASGEIVAPSGTDMDARLGMLWIAVAAVGGAWGAWNFPRNRRLRHAAQRPRSLTIANAACLGGMLGAGAALMFASQISNQLITFAAVAAVTFALMLVAGRGVPTS